MEELKRAPKRPKRKPIDLGINKRKNSIPKQRKHRVRLRAHLRGETLRRPLTQLERSYL